MQARGLLKWGFCFVSGIRAVLIRLSEGYHGVSR